MKNTKTRSNSKSARPRSLAGLGAKLRGTLNDSARSVANAPLARYALIGGGVLAAGGLAALTYTVVKGNSGIGKTVGAKLRSLQSTVMDFTAMLKKPAKASEAPLH